MRALSGNIPAMKSLLQKIGLMRSSSETLKPVTSLGSDILARLGSSDPDRVRYLAALGGLMGRIANADGDISTEEKARIESILDTYVELDKNEAEMVTLLIDERTKSLHGLENHLYTQELNELIDHDKKLEVLSCLFAVAAADDTISAEENSAVEVIAKGLLLSHRDFISVRSIYRKHLSVLKNKL